MYMQDIFQDPHHSQLSLPFLHIFSLTSCNSVTRADNKFRVLEKDYQNLTTYIKYLSGVFSFENLLYMFHFSNQITRSVLCNSENCLDSEVVWDARKAHKLWHYSTDDIEVWKIIAFSDNISRKIVPLTRQLTSYHMFWMPTEKWSNYLSLVFSITMVTSKMCFICH